MTDATALMPVLVLQAALRVLLMCAGLGQAAALNASAECLDLVMHCEIAHPPCKQAHAESRGAAFGATTVTPAIALQAAIRAVLEKAGVATAADTSVVILDLVMRSAAVRPSIRLAYSADLERQP